MSEANAPKEKKQKKGKVPMPEQEPKVRARNFLEVPTGYSSEMAQEEAVRCLQCKNPRCVDGCPVGIDIPGFIKLIKEGDFTGSIRHIWTMNSLPAVCGRVCPQESQCEGKCIAGQRRATPVAIGDLERFVADWERANGTGALPPKAAADGQEGRRDRLRPGRPDRRRRHDARRATKSRCSRPSTSRAACCSTAFRNSACPRTSSPQEVELPRAAGRQGANATPWSAGPHSLQELFEARLRGHFRGRRGRAAQVHGHSGRESGRRFFRQ